MPLTEETQVISFNCWRCNAPLLGAKWIEAGLTVVCVCGGWTRLPLVRDNRDAVEQRRREWIEADRGNVAELVRLGRKYLNQKG